ncbi:MAG: DUF3822 family protein [Bacteroidetes bacterium]|nr:DUF3822 family protein [Bacteroidota bacterium]
MLETGNKIQNIHTLIDESYQSDRPEVYDLFIYACENELSCAVAIRNSKQFIAMESWKIIASNLDYEDALLEARTQSVILKTSNFRRVICCSGFRNSTLIPNPLYDPSSSEDQLKFSHKVNFDDEIMTDELRQVEAKNVYSLPTSLYSSITHWFPNAEIHHSSTSLIEYLLSVNRNSKEEKMTINTHNQFIEIVVTRGKEILLYNSYDFESPEEMVYYILFVCEQLHLNPEIVDVSFCGEIEASDAAYVLTNKYIRNTQFAERPEHYAYSSVFNSIPTHYHFNLFSQLVCAS